MSQDIENTIAQLEAWRDRITTTIETLRYFLTQGAGLPSSPPPTARPSSGTDIPHDAFFQMTIPDAAEKYLGLTKQTKPNTDVAEALIKSGLKSAAKNFPETLRSILSRDDRFVRVNSEWGLAEWYPAMRRERKPRTTNGHDDPDMDSGKRAEDGREMFGQDVSLPPKGDSVRARALRLLDDSVQQIFSAKDVSKAIGAELETVRTALANLFRDDLIAKPSLGKYQSKKVQPANAA